MTLSLLPGSRNVLGILPTDCTLRGTPLHGWGFTFFLWSWGILLFPHPEVKLCWAPSSTLPCQGLPESDRLCAEWIIMDATNTELGYSRTGITSSLSVWTVWCSLFLCFTFFCCFSVSQERETGTKRQFLKVVCQNLCRPSWQTGMA